jgi:integrase/recombinase XerD
MARIGSCGVGHACRPALRLRRGGSAARLASSTREDLRKRYGYFLTFLKESGRLDEHASCASLVTPENVEAFVSCMRGVWSATTLFMTIHKLKQIARHLAPALDFKWLSIVAADLKAEGCPVKQRPVVDASELVIAGLALVAEYSERPMNLDTACHIRNGLMIALLASCPIRAKNLTGLMLGQSLRYSQSCWWVDLQGSETKSGRPDMRMVPEFLTPALENYLFTARPFLLSQPHFPGGANAIIGRSVRPAENSDAPTAAPECGKGALAAAHAGLIAASNTDRPAEPADLSGPLWIVFRRATLTP